MADALYDLWKNPARAAQMGRRGAAGVRRHYTVSPHGREVLRIYQEAISARSPTPLQVLSDACRRARGVARRVAVAEAGRVRLRDGAVGIGQEHACSTSLAGSSRRRRATCGCDAQRSLHAQAPTALAAFRNRDIGFVLQDHCLLPQCTVLENVLVPTLVGEADATAPSNARDARLLGQVGLTRSPATIGRPSCQAARSSGPRIARALVRQPRAGVVRRTDRQPRRGNRRQVVADLLLRLHHAQQHTILVVVTHSDTLGARFARRWSMKRGVLRCVAKA